jgi:hypothetical protein
MIIPFERHLIEAETEPAIEALSASLDRDALLGPPADAIATWRFERPLPDGFGPWLVNDLTLGTIRQFFDSDEACIDAGWPWLQIRGTVQAVEDALGWIEYEAAAVEAPNVRRAMWHRYQIAMGELPTGMNGLPLETDRLLDAEYLAGLSDPARAVFWRGHHGYDVRALVWGDGRWGDTIWGDDSGVRIEDGQTKWSHSRDHGPFEATADAATRTALGLDDFAAGTIGWTTPLTWSQLAGITWEPPTDEQIAGLLATVVSGFPIYVGFFDADGDLIGARRAIERKAAATFDGAPVPGDQTVLEITCRTGFGDGAGKTAASLAVLFDVRSANGPGDLWVAPDDLVPPDGQTLADVTVGGWPLNLAFTHTIREHITARVRLL